MKRRWNPYRFVKRTVVTLVQVGLKLSIILAVAGYASVIFIHLTNGFSFQTSLAAGFQDARLLMTCPRDISLQREFIDRSQIQQVGLGVAINTRVHVYSDICSNGPLSVAYLGEIGQEKMDARESGLINPGNSPSLNPTSTPATKLVYPQPPNVVAVRPTNTPASEYDPPQITVKLNTPKPVAPSPTMIITLKKPKLAEIPTVSIPAAAQPQGQTHSTSTPIPTKADLRSHLLRLINRDRAANGLSPVMLGNNPAAQQHAEEMLDHSYLSHWGLDGLTPYMRYTLAGGVNYEAENVFGVNSAPDPGLRYRTISPQQEIGEAQVGLMASPGHRDNILRPWHRKVNLGIACSRITCAVVQQFEGDYIEFDSRPTLNSGMLFLSGKLSSYFEFSGVQVWYEQLPHALTLGQLDRSRSYNLGERPAVFIREPPPPGSFYSKADDSTIFTWTSSVSPYDVLADTPRLEKGASDTRVSISLPRSSAEVPWITARSWVTSGGRFKIEADLASVIADNGPGVYTVLVWGKPDSGKDVNLTRYAIFVE